MAAISCKNLCKTFQQGDQTVIGLDHVDIDIAAGEMVCLSGPSGSGKTTLLNAMGGLDTPDSGEITVGGLRVDQMTKGERANMRLNNIGFVFQAYNLVPVLTAQENIEFVMQIQGVPTSERHRLSKQILARVGLSGLEHRRPNQLSGGQQQRVAVARAIVTKPTLVLADEPTANLDSSNAVQLIELFLELNKELDITFVIATHDQRVMTYCSRLITMVDGKIVEDLSQVTQAMSETAPDQHSQA